MSTIDYYNPGANLVQLSREHKGLTKSENHTLIRLILERPKDQNGDFVPFGDERDMLVWELRESPDQYEIWDASSVKQVRFVKPVFVPATCNNPDTGEQEDLLAYDFVSKAGLPGICIPVYLDACEAYEEVIHERKRNPARVALSNFLKTRPAAGQTTQEQPPDIA